jgi:hypothetical protein
MSGRECHHCKQWVEDGVKHATTEPALTHDLAEDLRDVWERLRETAVSFGDQRIYASHKSIMLSRKSCYFFVRPKKKFLEVCVFLGRPLKAPHVRRSDRASKSKVYHIIHLRHRGEVEAPVTDWFRKRMNCRIWCRRWAKLVASRSISRRRAQYDIASLQPRIAVARLQAQ